MNNQFLTQFLREDQDEVNSSIENVLKQTGADEELIAMFMNAIRQGMITPEKALEIIKTGFNKDISEDGMGGGSTTGGGVTNGATFTPGNGEQYAMGSKKISRKKLGENYYSFRNETKTRGKSDQFHEAVKIINKKLDEVNKLLEFTGTLKTELSESEDTFEIKTNTMKSMNKVRGKVIEAYQKLKQL